MCETVDEVFSLQVSQQFHFGCDLMTLLEIGSPIGPMNKSVILIQFEFLHYYRVIVMLFPVQMTDIRSPTSLIIQ